MAITSWATFPNFVAKKHENEARDALSRDYPGIIQGTRKSHSMDLFCTFFNRSARFHFSRILDTPLTPKHSKINWVLQAMITIFAASPTAPRGAIRLGYGVMWFPWRILNLPISGEKKRKREEKKAGEKGRTEKRETREKRRRFHSAAFGSTIMHFRVNYQLQLLRRTNQL